MFPLSKLLIYLERVWLWLQRQLVTGPSSSADLQQVQDQARAAWLERVNRQAPHLLQNGEAVPPRPLRWPRLADQTPLESPPSAQPQSPQPEPPAPSVTRHPSYGRLISRLTAWRRARATSSAPAEKANGKTNKATVHPHPAFDRSRQHEAQSRPTDHSHTRTGVTPTPQTHTTPPARPRQDVPGKPARPESHEPQPDLATETESRRHEKPSQNPRPGQNVSDTSPAPTRHHHKDTPPSSSGPPRQSREIGMTPPSAAPREAMARQDTMATESYQSQPAVPTDQAPQAGVRHIPVSSRAKPETHTQHEHAGTPPQSSTRTDYWPSLLPEPAATSAPQVNPSRTDAPRLQYLLDEQRGQC